LEKRTLLKKIHPKVMNQVYNKHLFLGPKARYLTPHGYLTPNSPEICTPKIANSLGSADSAE